MKTALLVETKNTPGALVRLLVPFAERGINLSKIESRPGTEPWSYRFFIEFEADTQGAAEALREAAPYAAKLQVLGSYARAANVRVTTG
jgi:chorismate mutase / prephenate dehydratase